MDRNLNKEFSMLALRRHYIHPHGRYNALRNHDSIYYDASSRCWLVTGYAPMTAILDDARFSSGLGANAKTVMPSISKQMLFMDGESHQRALNVMLRPLALMVKQIPVDLKRIATDALAQAQPAGEMDLVSDFASMVSLQAIAHVLGIPTENRAELLQLERWSDTFGDVTSGFFQGDMKDIGRLENYFRALIAEKRQAPGNDLLSAFIAAQDVFTQEEDLIANCIMVFTAGRLTTKKLIGNGVPLLFQQWKQHRQAFQNSPQTYTKTLGEELLRTIAPTRYLMRQATEDIDLSIRFPGNHLIRRGERVLLFLEAANYDPVTFPEPEQFNPQRRPNKHIAFGYGNHQCPGATMGRMEIQIALETLLSHAELRSKPGTTPTWNPNPNLGGYTSYPILIKPYN